MVRGIQSRGVAACPKHYVANEAETDRTTVDNLIDERILHELYLAPFEMVVRDADPWMVMSAYNGVNGAPMSENVLLAEPLKGAWGWDGLVVSDWGSIYDTVPSARSSLDLAMFGPEPLWGAPLLEAIEAGEVSEQDIDAKVLRLLRLAARVGKLDGWAPAPVVDGAVEEVSALAREAAAAGTVLLSNDGILPLDRSALRSVALIGPGALEPHTQGGGSAMVFSRYLVTPEAGLRDALGTDVQITTAMGAALSDALRPPLPEELGAVVIRWMDDEGTVLEEEESSTTWLYRSFRSVCPGSTALELRTRFVPTATGEWRLGVAGGPGAFELLLDGEPVLKDALGGASQATGEGEVNVPESAVTMSLTRGVGVDVVVRYRWSVPMVGFSGGFAVRQVLGTEDDMIREAAETARSCDVAVVVVGTNDRLEREGGDRVDLRLPGRQDELVAAVVAANPRTVVVVNAGAPVAMPWRDDAAAVLLTWFPGMECGNALADVLLGSVEPGGRLPTTLPTDMDNAPVTSTRPEGGVLKYVEGWRIGYNAHLDRGTTPAFWFGHGLGYTSWAYVELEATTAAARVSLRNTGDRPGKHVVMVYAGRPQDGGDLRPQSLVGYGSVAAEPGQSVVVDIPIDLRMLRRWDVEAATWQLDPGPVIVSTGPSVGDLVLQTTIEIEQEKP